MTPPVLAIHRGAAAQLGELIERERELVRKTFADFPYGNIELRGGTLLHCAVEFGEHECVAELFRRGADINARSEVHDGIGGQTPVFHAVASLGHGNCRTLHSLAQHAGQKIDASVRATFRRFGQVYSALTPLELAEHFLAEAPPERRSKADEEIALQRTLAGRDRRARKLRESPFRLARFSRCLSLREPCRLLIRTSSTFTFIPTTASSTVAVASTG